MFGSRKVLKKEKKRVEGERYFYIWILWKKVKNKILRKQERKIIKKFPP